MSDIVFYVTECDCGNVRCTGYMGTPGNFKGLDTTNFHVKESYAVDPLGRIRGSIRVPLSRDALGVYTATRIVP